MPDTPDLSGRYKVGDWIIDPALRTFSRDGQSERADPKAIDLLCLLASDAGRVFSRQEIFEALWPNMIVGEDTLAKTISRLRKALGDQASSPKYVETIPKRGYRLTAAVEPLVEVEPDKTRFRFIAGGFAIGLAALLIALWPGPDVSNDTAESIAQISRADDLYMKFTRADNEAAIGLYERVLEESPDNTKAQAGLANALVQRVIRWSDASPKENVSLRNALEIGANTTSDAQLHLQRAELMARQAVRRRPDDPEALKSLGFVLSALGQVDQAQLAYLQSLESDPLNWPSLVNLGELELIEGDLEGAIGYFEDAYAAMEQKYPEQPQLIDGWQADLGVEIGKAHLKLKDLSTAEVWFERVREIAPFHADASRALAQVYKATGRTDEGDWLCREQARRLGHEGAC